MLRLLELWLTYGNKCVGTRRVIAIVNVESPDLLDRILLDLPIMKHIGQHVQVEVILNPV